MNSIRTALRKGYYYQSNDEGQATQVKIDPFTKERLNADIIGAERMVLDSSALDALAELMIQHPDFIRQFISRIRLPFNKTYIEFDFNYLNHAIKKLCGDEDELLEPKYVSYMCKTIAPDSHKFTITEFEGSDPSNGDVGDINQLVTFFSYLIDPLSNQTAWTSEVVSKLDTYFIAKNATSNKYEPRSFKEFIASSLANIVEQHTIDNTEQEENVLLDSVFAILDHAKFISNIYQPKTGPGAVVSNYVNNGDPSNLSELQKRKISESVIEDLRTYPITLLTIMPLLIMLNMQSELEAEWIRSGTGMTLTVMLNKDYLRHTTVHINLKASDVIAAIKRLGNAGISIAKRRHAVRGHWCVSRRIGDPRCITVRQVCKPIALDTNHNYCALCNKPEWRKKETMRGDARLGFVTHDYVVSATEK